MPQPNVKAATVPMTALDETLLYAVRYGLFFVFVLPFIVLLSHLYPWVSGKIWGFEILIELIFPLYVLLAFRRREFRPSRTAFLWAMLAYFGVATLSMLLGDNPHRSLWSKPDRLTGMFFQYHLLAFFLMAGSVWRGVMVQPIAAAILTAVALSLHAVKQVVFPETADSTRGMATFGNPSYLGQYLVPHLFLCAWLIKRHFHSRWRFLWMASAVLIFFGIFSTKSKGALVGVFLGALAASLLAAFRGRGRARRWAIVGLTLLALAVAGYFVANKIKPIKDWMYQERLDLQYFRETSGSRKLLLANAIEGIKQRPILGWGPENFESAFYLNYDPLTLRYSEYETRQDRPHNLVLEMLSHLGVVGLLAYVAVFAMAVRSAARKDHPDAFSAGVLATAAFAQLGTNLFIFETPMSYMALFFMFSLVAVDGPGPVESGPDESSAGAVGAFFAALALSLWALFGVVIGTISAAKLTSQAIISLQNPLPADRFRALVEGIMEKRTPLLERDLRAVTSHLSRPRGQHLEGDYRPILEKLSDYEFGWLERSPRDYVLALVTSSAYLSLDRRTPEQQRRLEVAVERMKAGSPNRHEVFWIEAQMRIERGELEAAEALFERAAAFDPENPLGVAAHAGFLLQYRDVVKAVERLEPHWQAVRGDGTAWDYIELASLELLNARRWDDLARLHEASVRHGEQNVQWTLVGVLAAYAKGETAKAEAIIAEAKELYPNDAGLIDQVVASRGEIIGTPRAAPEPAP